jgi:hypothetical protein
MMRFGLGLSVGEGLPGSDVAGVGRISGLQKFCE